MRGFQLLKGLAAQGDSTAPIVKLFSMVSSRELNVPTALHKEIRWFKQEIEVCEQVIAEVESDANFGPSKRSTLANLRATLAVHREKLAELETRMAREG